MKNKNGMYVDGFLIILPKKNLPAYKKMAMLGEKIWLKHGAIDYKECVGDDLNVKMGLPFPKLVKVKPNETIVFSYIVFKSKAHRNQVNSRVMKDPEMSPEHFKDKPMPFDMDKMAYGGFKALF